MLNNWLLISKAHFYFYSINIETPETKVKYKQGDPRGIMNSKYCDKKYFHWLLFLNNKFWWTSFQIFMDKIWGEIGKITKLPASFYNKLYNFKYRWRHVDKVYKCHNILHVFLKA